MSEKRIALAGDEIAVISPYVADEVAAIKRVPGARWDRLAKVWRIPMTSLEQVRAYGRRFGYDIDSDLTGFELPPHPVGESRIEVQDALLLYFPYDPVLVKAARKIPGARWDGKGAKAWKAPLEAINPVLEFAERFNISLDGDREKLYELRDEVNAERHRRLELSRAEDADVEIAGLAGALRPFQRAGVMYAAETKRCFIADQMGLGKTIQALAALEYMHERGERAFPAVVVAPPSLVLNWRFEIEKFFPHRTTSIVTGRKEFPEEEADYLIVGWSNIHTWSKKLVGYQSYIFDESHAAKNPDAQRTKAARKMARKAPHVFLLTGTPIKSRPAEYASQLQIIDQLRQFGGKWPFLIRYAGAFKDQWGQWNIKGSSNLEELNERLRSTCFIRRTKSQVLHDLAPDESAVIHVAPDEKVMKEYRQAEEDIATFMAERAAMIAQELGLAPHAAAVRARIRAESNEHLVRLGVLRRLAGLAKLDAIRDWVQTHIDEGSKVVIAAHHRDVVDVLADEFGGLKIQGGMKTVDVEENKRRFQKWPPEEAPVIVVSIQAGGEGHTLTAAQDILIVEEPWTPTEVDQVVSRLHRIGQEGSVLATHMLAEGTIDEDMYRIVEDKRRVVEAATEGRTVKPTATVGDLLLSFAGI